MLNQLIIKNFAIIDEVEVSFGEGLTVIIGETGAGKSIIADAIDFLLGLRANSDLIKSNTNKAVVEGIFSFKGLKSSILNTWLNTNGFESSGSDGLLISRELTSQGSKVRINGSLGNVSHLNFLREHLVEIHKQSEQIDLLRIEKQLEILDSFGDSNHRNLLQEYKNKFLYYEDIKLKLTNVKEKSEDTEKKIDFLKHEINEIESAWIRNINEEDELKEKREILLNKKELSENTKLISQLINSDNESAISIITQIKKLVQKSSEYDKRFNDYINSVETSIAELKELSSFVSNYDEMYEADSVSLEEIEERLDIFFSLKKKYGKTLEEILNYKKKATDELNELKGSSVSKEDLEKQFKSLEKEISVLGDKLSASREKITTDFVNKINEELKSLGFNSVLFVVEFTNCDLSRTGKEQIQFLFSANPDESPKPLLKIASGGELSRIMLSIKSVVSKDSKSFDSTMIFDEVDTGVSGEVSANVAKKLYKISRNSQIICISHQPIIASMSDHLFIAQKKVVDGITRVSVNFIEEKEMAYAITTLLTPERNSKDISNDAIKYANSLLENAKKIKEQSKSSILS